MVVIKIESNIILALLFVTMQGMPARSGNEDAFAHSSLVR